MTARTFLGYVLISASTTMLGIALVKWWEAKEAGPAVFPSPVAPGQASV